MRGPPAGHPQEREAAAILIFCSTVCLAPTQLPPNLTPGVHHGRTVGATPAVVVSSSNQTIDLSGVELIGNPGADQEHYAGIGILLDHCQNLVVRNGKVHGYRINLLLRSCKNVRIEGLDASASHAYPIRSSSGQPIDRFLNLRNVNDWTGYGAGIWLHNCTACRIRRCTAHGAMNGAVLVGCSSCTVYDCDFSYNSAWGLALWASSLNRLLWNHLDFCNRPWSGGWGGDAADMVLVSGSNQNMVVGNSMTHGGDGFFLADRVEGGWNESEKRFHFQDSSDHNVVWANDGSWASANAFEATFSRDNRFGSNIASASRYGFWLGYSSESRIENNIIDQNDRDGVAIEHGQANLMLANHFDGDREAAIHLWSTHGPRDDDRPSADNVVRRNLITNCGANLDLVGSRHTTVDEPKGGRGRSAGKLEVEPLPPGVSDALSARPPRWKSYREAGGPVGQAWIQAGLYAPTPIQHFGAAKVGPGIYKLWFVREPSTIDTPSWVSLKYGEDRRYVTARASTREAVGSDRLAIVSFVLPGARRENRLGLRFRTGSWDCRWFKWKDLAYEDREGWNELFSSKPVTEQKLPELNADFSEASPVPGVLPRDHYALLATRSFLFKAGVYRFNTVSDDGIRVSIDGNELISRWDHHGGTADTAQIHISEGRHELRVEYCQEDGSAQIRLDWSPLKLERSRPTQPKN